MDLTKITIEGRAHDHATVIISCDHCDQAITEHDTYTMAELATIIERHELEHEQPTIGEFSGIPATIERCPHWIGGQRCTRAAHHSLA